MVSPSVCSVRFVWLTSGNGAVGMSGLEVKVEVVCSCDTSVPGLGSQ